MYAPGWTTRSGTGVGLRTDQSEQHGKKDHDLKKICPMNARREVIGLRGGKKDRPENIIHAESSSRHMPRPNRAHSPNGEKTVGLSGEKGDIPFQIMGK